MWLYGWALLIGFFLGLFLSILRQYGGKILSMIASVYIEIIRGTPLLAQLLFIYYLPFGFDFTWEVSFILFGKEISIILLNYRTFVGIIVLGLNSSAYQAEYFRGAIMSVGAGQLNAAKSIGMGRLKGVRHIVLPQAIRRVIPAWSNEAAYLPKYTVVVWFIAVEELFAQTRHVVSITFLTLPAYIVTAFIFLITISIITKLLDVLYKRISIPGV